jgi:hypothetical protein
MKSILRLVLVSLVTLAFAGVALAQTGSTGSTGTKSTAPAKPAAEKKAKTMRATGELIAADAKAGTATVKTKDKELTFSDATQTAKDALAKVKVGDMVKTAYVEKDGKLTLNSLAKTKPPTVKSTPTKSSDKPMESKPAAK